MQIEYLPIDLLELSGFRPPNFVPKASSSLVNRLVEGLVAEVVTVRRLDAKRFEILSRPDVWVAAGLAQHSEIAASVVAGLSDDEARAIVSECYGLGETNALQRAESFRRLRSSLATSGKKMTIAELARRVGISRSRLSHTLRLLNLDATVQSMLRSGELSEGHARTLLRFPASQQRSLARQVVSKGLSVRECERLAAEGEGGGVSSLGDSAKSAKDPDVIRLERELGDILGCTVSLGDRQLSINYFGDNDVLSGVLGRLGYNAR